MKLLDVTCDVATCTATGTRLIPEPGDPGTCVACHQPYDDPEGVSCPEGWGVVTLSDSNGELQEHLICPEHVKEAWAFLVERRNPEIQHDGKSSNPSGEESKT